MGKKIKSRNRSASLNNWTFSERNDAKTSAERTLSEAKRQDKGKVAVRVDAKTVKYV